MQRLLLAVIFIIFPTVGYSVCYESGNTYHPLLGSAFCGSTSADSCRAQHFDRDIKLSWKIDTDAMVGNDVWAFVGAYNLTKDTVKRDAGITLTATTRSVSSNDPEIIIHFRKSNVPDANNCRSGDTRGKSSSNGLACLHQISGGHSGLPDVQYTKGHVKCHVYLNLSNASVVRDYNDEVERAYVARTVKHEIGHCLGLDHHKTRSRLMYGTNYCGPLWSAYYQNCDIGSDYRYDIEDGYRGFLSIPQDQPFTADSTLTNLKINWTPYENWWDETDCTYDTGYNGQLKNGSKPTAKKKRDGRSACYTQIQYWSGYFGWKNTSSTSLCSHNACRAICR